MATVASRRLLSATDVFNPQSPNGIRKERVVQYLIHGADEQDVGGVLMDLVTVSIGDSYSLGNDSDDSIFLKSKGPPTQLNERDFTKWHVTLRYDNDPMPDPEEPNNFWFSIKPSYISERERIQAAPYFGLGAFDAGGDFEPLGDIGGLGGNEGDVRPITNSCRVPLFPALEDDVFLPSYIIRQRILDWDRSIGSFVGAVNEDPLTLKWTVGGLEVFPETEFDALTLLCSSIGVQIDRQGGTPSYIVEMELVEKEDGWRHAELDKGRGHCPDDLEQVGSGTGSSSTVKTAPLRVARDDDGSEIPDDAPMDGHGHLLDKDATGLDDFRYLIWGIKPEKDLNQIPKLLFQFDAGWLL